MCGIVGIARAAGAPPSPPGLLQRMAAAIVHRGPDDEGFHSAERAMIGMRRLSIIDLAGGHQPIANEDETLWLVCNGEIYNYRELREALLRRGHVFRTGSDVEVLLHLYEEQGDRFLDQVSGMFAAALWDDRRKRLVLVRDRLGIKPLYYMVANGSLVFASEMKCLIEVPGCVRELDHEALQEYLTFGYAVAPRTLLRAIRKLPPASMLTWEGAGTAPSVRAYWEIPETVRADVDAGAWVEIVRTELDRAVREHMVSDVPIGAFLSGGLDSSAVVALMARYSDRPVNTYAIGYTGPGAASHYNELSYAAIVARHFGTQHVEIPVDPDVAALLPKLMWHVEEPISDSASITTFLVSELAAKHVKVILSGVGGDELFAGYNRYLGEHYGRRYRLLPTWMRRGVIRPLARLLPAGRQNRLMDLSRYARKFIDGGELPWRDQYRTYVEICAQEQVRALLREPAAGNGRDGFDLLASAQTTEDSLLRLLRLDAGTQLAEDLLLLTDKVTMAASIECRVPFLDHRLVEIAGTIPQEIKLRGGEPKYILRRALQGIVPREILERGKRGFGAPLGSWLKAELRTLRTELLDPEVIESRGLLSPAAVQAVIAAHDANREDYSDLLLVLINLEIWCRLFLDRRTVADVGSDLTELAGAA